MLEPDNKDRNAQAGNRPAEGELTPGPRDTDLREEIIARDRDMAIMNARQVPADFGARGGTAISNKDTILGEVDRFLGRSKPPALEYLFVEPLANVRLPDGRESGMNPFGHACLRYTMPSGEQKLMNISGMAGHDMVNFFDPADYLFGTAFPNGNEQHGVYNRTMIGLRVEETRPDRIERLDEYFLNVRDRQRSGDARFHLYLSRIVNAIDWALPIELAQMGNCAGWTSSGLKSAGFTDWRSYYPKRIFVKLLGEVASENPESNWNVISYQRVSHAARTDGLGEELRGPVSPVHLFSSRKFRDLHSMDFVKGCVHVPEGEIEARIKPGPWPRAA